MRTSRRAYPHHPIFNRSFPPPVSVKRRSSVATTLDRRSAKCRLDNASYFPCGGSCLNEYELEVCWSNENLYFRQRASRRSFHF